MNTWQDILDSIEEYPVANWRLLSPDFQEEFQESFWHGYKSFAKGYEYDEDDPVEVAGYNWAKLNKPKPR